MLYYSVYSYPKLLPIMYSDLRGRSIAKIKMRFRRMSKWAGTKRGYTWKGVCIATRHLALPKHLDAGTLTEISSSTPISHVFLMDRTAEVEKPTIGGALTSEQMASSLAASQILERIDFWSSYLDYVVFLQGKKVSTIEQFRKKKEEVISESVSRPSNHILQLANHLDSRNEASLVQRIIKNSL